MLNFDYSLDGLGAELTCEDGRSVYLQGEDADSIRELDEWIDNTEFPHDAYETAQDAINQALEDYFLNDGDHQREASKKASKFAGLKRVANEAPEGINESIEFMKGKLSDQLNNLTILQENLGAVEMDENGENPKPVEGEARLAGLKRIAAENPEAIEECLSEFYAAMDEMCSFTENLADNLNVDLPTPGAPAEGEAPSEEDANEDEAQEECPEGECEAGDEECAEGCKKSASKKHKKAKFKVYVDHEGDLVTQVGEYLRKATPAEAKASEATAEGYIPTPADVREWLATAPNDGTTRLASRKRAGTREVVIEALKSFLGDRYDKMNSSAGKAELQSQLAFLQSLGLVPAGITVDTLLRQVRPDHEADTTPGVVFTDDDQAYLDSLDNDDQDR